MYPYTPTHFLRCLGVVSIYLYSNSQCFGRCIHIYIQDFTYIQNWYLYIYTLFPYVSEMYPYISTLFHIFYWDVSIYLYFLSHMYVRGIHISLHPFTNVLLMYLYISTPFHKCSGDVSIYLYSLYICLGDVSLYHYSLYICLGDVSIYHYSLHTCLSATQWERAGETNSCPDLISMMIG